MAKSRRTRAALEQEIQKLLDEKKASEEKAAALFAKAFLTKEMKNKIADMSDDEIKDMAKKMADEVKASMKTDSGEKVEVKKSNTDVFAETLFISEVKKQLNAKDVEVVKLAAENISKLINNVLSSAENEFNLRQQKADKNRKY